MARGRKGKRNFLCPFIFDFYMLNIPYFKYVLSSTSLARPVVISAHGYQTIIRASMSDPELDQFQNIPSPCGGDII
jgi:hypothetical protein